MMSDGKLHVARRSVAKRCYAARRVLIAATWSALINACLTDLSEATRDGTATTVQDCRRNCEDDAACESYTWMIPVMNDGECYRSEKNQASATKFQRPCNFLTKRQIYSEKGEALLLLSSCSVLRYRIVVDC